MYQIVDKINYFDLFNIMFLHPIFVDVINNIAKFFFFLFWNLSFSLGNCKKLRILFRHKLYCFSCCVSSNKEWYFFRRSKILGWGWYSLNYRVDKNSPFFLWGWWTLKYRVGKKNNPSHIMYLSTIL